LELTAAIERDYDEIHESIEQSPEQRRTEIVQRLLAEEPVEFAEIAELDYELDAWHLGMIATGSDLQDTFRRVTVGLDCQCLHVSRGNTLWAWLGAPRKQKGTEVERLFSVSARCDSLAIGGLWRGLDGWRQTHREAKGALPRALGRPDKIVRYADGPLVAAALESETLAVWLREFLTPLLRAYPGRVV
jgi:GGDEF-like domain